MGYCNYCNTYYKKQYNSDICKKCSQELSCTPPSINNSMKQLEMILHKKNIDTDYESKYKKTATLMDLAADELIYNKDQLIRLIDILPDGNLPWNSLLKAWYRHNKQKGRNINNEKKPRDRLLKLMDISISEYKFIESDIQFDQFDIDFRGENIYITFNKDIEGLEELDKIEELDN